MRPRQRCCWAQSLGGRGGGASVDIESDAGCVDAALRLCGRGCGAVVMTLGGRGCLVVRGDGGDGSSSVITAPKVTAVDTVGAGDCFLGAMAAYLAMNQDSSSSSSNSSSNSNSSSSSSVSAEEGEGVAARRVRMLGGGVLERACSFAVQVASISVTREGAQSSYPNLVSLPDSIRSLCPTTTAAAVTTTMPSPPSSSSK